MVLGPVSGEVDQMVVAVDTSGDMTDQPFQGSLFLFIGLTDLYSDFPETPPPYPVIWLTPASHRDAPWGGVIRVLD